MHKALAVSVAAIILALPTLAAAQTRGPRGPVEGVVVAESFYGHGTATAPVRRNSKGRLEVGLPGGTWYECAFSCSDTLRRQTVDFWENHSGRPRDGGGDGVGYFRFRWP
ncbi:MAG TPA: hypothetical protein VFR00_13480 [Hyphomicrobiaceae bacterium]|nr:hypothetical protein [Hyphomicrobiaceae bacterium]